MLALETTATLSGPTDISSSTATRRPLYIWVSMGAAALIGLDSLLLLALTLALPPLANSLSALVIPLLTATTIGCIGTIHGLAQNRKWAIYPLFAICLLLLPSSGLALNKVIEILTAAPNEVNLFYLRSALVLFTSTLYMVVLAWVTLAALWRRSARFAEVILFLFAFLLIGMLALAPRLTLP